MGFLRNVFKSKLSNKYSNNDIDVIGASAQRLVDVINESLKIANDSNNPETKLSRLSVAKNKLEDVKGLAARYSFLTITSLDEIEDVIAKLESDFMMSGLKEIANGNNAGEALEKEGKVEEAIAQYEILAEKGVDTPFTYRRLAILYRKGKKREDEIRTIKAALNNIPKSNAKHYSWFEDRLTKMNK